MIKVWTDGSASLTTGHGGWAFFLRFGGKETDRFGWSDSATNNVMEITALIRALQFIPAGSTPLTVYTDSQYLQRAVTQWVRSWMKYGWLTSTGAPVKNPDYLQQAWELFEYHRSYRQAQIAWVRGHSGVEENEHADFLAGLARVEKTTNWTIKDNRSKL